MLKKTRRRLARTKAGKVTKGSVKTVKFLSKPFQIIAKNPLSLKAYLVMFVIFLFLAIFSGASAPTAMEQDEFELNQSWLYLSKLDREKSSKKVDYWTNIDDITFYMNYRYGDYKLSDHWVTATSSHGPVMTAQTYQNALDSIWDNLNKDTSHLKEMADLYGKNSKVAWMMLSKDDREEYKELLEESKETGRYIVYQELENPFYTEADEVNYKAPLVVIKRYGYSSKTKIYEGTQLKATAGQTLRAVFSGTVSLSGNDLTIKTADAEFTYKDVQSSRFKDGETIAEGAELGTVKGSRQEIYYKKLEEKATKTKKAKWTYVNPGFYFQLVTYSQTTSVLTDLNISGDLASRVKAIRDYVKKAIPNATDNGIAAMLGNFATESNITAKRAESDYLKPPVGASDSSWDDESWLNMGYTDGASIGSLVIHRGLGLGMWTDTSDGANRSTLLRNYAKQKNKKWYELELQIDFMLEGDNPYYITILKNILTSNDDVATLTKRFLNNWEGNSGDKLVQRQDSAKQMLAYFKQASSSKASGIEASSYDFPSGWESKLAFGKPSSAALTTLPGNAYPAGQCTWYVANRLIETGTVGNSLSSNNGNGQDWVMNLVAKGWRYSTTPTAGAVCSTAGGFDNTYAAYGHVMFVEAVNDDGTFLISECNYDNVQDRVHYRVLSNQPYYTFATPN